MMRPLATNIVLLLAATSVSACSLQPKYVRPELPVPPSWPVGDAYLRQNEAALPSVTYRDVFRDTRLQAIIDQALANNRDLRVAAANIVATRAQYRIQRADLFPQVDATGGYTYRDNGSVGTTTTGTATSGGGRSSISASVGASAFEIDLFGRIRSLTDAALDRYFAQEAGARATRLTLVGDIATAWATYGADQSLLKVSVDTVASAQRSVRLTQSRLSGGIAPRTDLRQAEQILATAQAGVAEQTTAVAQDVNALQRLVGAPVAATLLPASIDDASAGLAALPAGIDSAILLRRPDVVQAEYTLRAFNAEIGAARAELFPRITLTGLFGLASTALRTLFTGAAFNYSAGASASYPIFRAGAARAGVEYSQAQRDGALATYEATIQTAFREVSDQLARRGTITEQLAANRRFAAAAADTYRLTEARYRGGIDTFLSTLDAQRSLYSAQRTLVATQLTGATNLVSLYTTLGGDSTLDAPTGAGPRAPVAAAQQNPQQ